MIIGLFAKIHHPRFRETARRVINWSQERGIEILLEQSVAEHLQVEIGPSSGASIAERAELIIVLGGDGTMLSVARLVAPHQCPILGVNLGSLGFLTEVRLEDLDSALEHILDENVQFEKRYLLEAVVRRSGHPDESYLALNDVVINKAALARVIEIDTFSASHFLAGFTADGVIVSTPTGSTAYSLSAGGPILYPQLQAILLTPICPHALTNRPVVLPAQLPLRLVLREGENVMATIDGQVGLELSVGDEITCQLSGKFVRLVRPFDRPFFEVLREKLKWSER